MNYELIFKEDEKEFYLKSSFGLISIHEMKYARNELFWKNRDKIEHMLAWLNENHPELML